MTQDPNPQLPVPGDPADPLDDTQPVEVAHFAPTPDPRPDTRWAWATPEPRAAAGTWSAAPSRPDPSAAPAWATSAPGLSTGVPGASAGAAGSAAWAAPASSSTASWGTGGAGSAGSGQTPPGVLTAPPVRSSRSRSGAGVGTVTAVALLAAIVASGGTALALGASGAFDQPAPTVALGVAATGQPTAVPTALSSPGGVIDESAAVVSSAAKVSPAVVKITVLGASGDPFSAQTEGIGSGIVYNPSGWIITNHHVVTGANSITVELKDGRTFAGSVYGIDTLTDLAIVKVAATGLPAASMGSSDALKVGQLVVAVGSPLGTYSFSVTSGVVSGKGRSVTTNDGTTLSNLIDTDAAINPGNSGGPLADADGNVVGINTAVDTTDGIGYAIPIDIAKPIMAQAVRGEKLVRPFIGVRYEMVDPTLKKAQSLTVNGGALIISDPSSGGSAVTPGSPAATAGLKDGDVITAINGVAVDQEHPLNLLLVQYAPQDTIRLTVVRGGQTLTVALTLGVRPDGLQ